MAFQLTQSGTVPLTLRVLTLFISLGSMGLCAAFSQGSFDSNAGNPVVALHQHTAGLPEGGALQNDRISASWQIQDGHITSLVIQDKTPHSGFMDATLALDGPFWIELKDAGVLRASALQISGAARVEQLTPDPAASRASDRLPGVTVHYALADPAGQFQADWALTLRQGSSYIRQILTITAGNKPVAVSSVAMIDVRSPGIAVAGTVKGSPLTVGNFYLGFESPLAESSVVGDRGVSELPSGVPIGVGKSAQYSSVIGVATTGQMRRNFLAYLERERAHPYRTFLHYNSWFDIGFGNPYSQQEALERIHAFGEELNKKRGVTLDSFLFGD